MKKVAILCTHRSRDMIMNVPGIASHNAVVVVEGGVEHLGQRLGQGAEGHHLEFGEDAKQAIGQDRQQEIPTQRGPGSLLFSMGTLAPHCEILPDSIAIPRRFFFSPWRLQKPFI